MSELFILLWCSDLWGLQSCEVAIYIVCVALRFIIASKLGVPPYFCCFQFVTIDVVSFGSLNVQAITVS